MKLVIYKKRCAKCGQRKYLHSDGLCPKCEKWKLAAEEICPHCRNKHHPTERCLKRSIESSKESVKRGWSFGFGGSKGHGSVVSHGSYSKRVGETRGHKVKYWGKFFAGVSIITIIIILVLLWNIS
tara:strand:+ start:78 stop:455 length:378 start_codon:yes stop_codon:yes gene_type:complete